MTVDQIKEVVQLFANGARRARAAGLDGVELHASHGYLFTQFLSAAINDRKDEYGGSLENRARFLLEVIHAIYQEVRADFHLQVKINAVDFNNALFPWEKKGITLGESIQICRMVEAVGVDAIHVSIGSIFPHPLLPPGGFPPDEANWWYDNIISSGDTTGAIGGKLLRHRLDGLTDLLVISRLGLVVERAAREPRHLAEACQWRGGAQHGAQLPLLVVLEPQSCEAFLARSSAIVSRPTKRSSSTMRSRGSSRSVSALKRSSARSRHTARDRIMTCSLRLCSGQIYAIRCRPVNKSRTTWVLNFAGNLRCCGIVAPPAGQIVPHYGICPAGGAYYTELPQRTKRPCSSI
jgi:hypothetical protein